MAQTNEGSEGTFPALEQVRQVTANATGAAFFSAVGLALSRFLPEAQVLFVTAEPEALGTLKNLQVRCRAVGGASQISAASPTPGPWLEQVFSMGEVVLHHSARAAFPEDAWLQEFQVESCVAARIGDGPEGSGALLVLNSKPVNQELTFSWLSILRAEIARERTQRAARRLRAIAELATTSLTASSIGDALDKLCQVVRAELGAAGVAVCSPKGALSGIPAWVSRGMTPLSAATQHELSASAAREELAWLELPSSATQQASSSVLCARIGPVEALDAFLLLQMPRALFGKLEADFVRALAGLLSATLQAWAARGGAALETRSYGRTPKLQQLQKLESLALLAGGIAHDFNNLLVGILGNVGLLLLDTPEGSPLLAGLEDIQSAALRAADLTKQMLTYSGRGRFVPQAVELNRWVEEVVQLFSSALAQRATLKLDLYTTPLLVEADPAQLRELILNLLTNAADALSESAGSISVSTGDFQADREYLEKCFADEALSEGRYAYVEVADTGPGMDPSTVDKIFDPFFTTKFKGRGLGLPAVLGILRGHRGAIHVDTQPGQGARFRALFPVALPRPEKHPEPAQELGLGYVGTGCILVADDEETVRTVTERVLSQAGFDVMLATDGLEALEMYKRNWQKIALVLLDMTMPGMTGKQVFEAIRAVRGDVRVMLTSGYTEDDVKASFADRALAGFLQKPWLPGELLAAVKNALES